MKNADSHSVEDSVLFQRVDRLLDDLLYPLWDSETGNGQIAFNPPGDVDERDDGYIVFIDLPGTSKRDIKVQATATRLIVIGRHTHGAYAKFEKRFALPADVNADGIDVFFENGVLEIFIPKTQWIPMNPRDLPIRSRFTKAERTWLAAQPTGAIGNFEGSGMRDSARSARR